MTFTTTYLIWRARWERTVLSGLVFCDWCEENGRHPDYTTSWRGWLKMSGVFGFECDLKRLANAESVQVCRRRARGN